jgi:peptidoglycan hydrolase CwlO-like protein
MFKSIFFVLVFSVSCLAQAQQQPTPQQTISTLVSQQANLSAQIITVLNQVPELVKQNQDLQAQVKDLQEKLNKKEVKK